MINLVKKGRMRNSEDGKKIGDIFPRLNFLACIFMVYKLRGQTWQYKLNQSKTHMLHWCIPQSKEVSNSLL